MSETGELHVQTENVTNAWEGPPLQLPPGWKLLGQELEGDWYAIMPDMTPVVVAWGENPQELVWEIARKAEIMMGIKRCWCSIHSYLVRECHGT